MNEVSFWLQVKHRRNLYFWWWLSWLPAGYIVLLSYYALAGGEAPFVFIFTLLIVWGIGSQFVARWLSELICPRCGKPAICGPYFFMRHAKCQHCGFSHAGT